MNISNLINENLELIRNLQEKLIELKVAQGFQGKKDYFIEPPIGAPIKGSSATLVVYDDMVESKQETTEPIEMPMYNSPVIHQEAILKSDELVDAQEASRILEMGYSTFMFKLAGNKIALLPFKKGTHGHPHLFKKEDILKYKASLPPPVEPNQQYVTFTGALKVLGISSFYLRNKIRNGEVKLKEYRRGVVPMYLLEEVNRYTSRKRHYSKHPKENVKKSKKKTFKDLVSKVPDNFALENKPNEMRINLMYSDFDYLNLTEASKYLGIHATKLWWWTTKPNPPLFNSRNEQGQVQYLFSDLKKYKEENVKK